MSDQAPKPLDALAAPGGGAPSGASASGTVPAESTPPSTAVLIGAASIGAAMSVALGVYGRTHQATGLTIAPLRLDQMLPAKAGLATVAVVLAVAQLVSALWLFGRLPRAANPPSWLGLAHRWSGTAAFVLSLPIAYHCLWSLGFQTTTPRVVAHSLLGCAFYGAFATKLLVLRSKRMPNWALPIVGSTLVTLLVGIWFTSAFWFYTTT